MKKSFQVMNVKMAVAASAGLESGRMIRKKMPKWPHPSMRAASLSSSGIARKNWTSRKMKKASVASSLGTMKGK